jgi:hypothetical protein
MARRGRVPGWQHPGPTVVHHRRPELAAPPRQRSRCSADADRSSNRHRMSNSPECCAPQHERRPPAPDPGRTQRLPPHPPPRRIAQSPRRRSISAFQTLRARSYPKSSDVITEPSSVSRKRSRPGITVSVILPPSAVRDTSTDIRSMSLRQSRTFSESSCPWPGSIARVQGNLCEHPSVRHMAPRGAPVRFEPGLRACQSVSWVRWKS